MRGLLLLLSSLLLLACGPNFDPPSKLRSLRVMGVQKDVPYAQPGEDVHLKMLWQDAAPDALVRENKKRDVTVTWSGPCFNPQADLYYGCFSDPTLFAKARAGDEQSFTMPDDIIRPSSDATNPPHGIAYVFFTVCAGTLTPLSPSANTAFPIGCQDREGNLLGSDDFVAGYASVYSFDTFSNKNPVISGFQFDGHVLEADAFCVDGARDTGPAAEAEPCQTRAGSTIPGDIACDDDNPLCIDHCDADGDDSCPDLDVRPVLERSRNQETDGVAKELLGRDVTEQMWIDYYTDAGAFKSDVRLLNDATAGWNESYDTLFRAPKATGPTRVWVVVHDNRGGASWAGVTLQVR